MRLLKGTVGLGKLAALAERTCKDHWETELCHRIVTVTVTVTVTVAVTVTDDLLRPWHPSLRLQKGLALPPQPAARQCSGYASQCSEPQLSNMQKWTSWPRILIRVAPAPGGGIASYYHGIVIKYHTDSSTENIQRWAAANTETPSGMMMIRWHAAPRLWNLNA